MTKTTSSKGFNVRADLAEKLPVCDDWSEALHRNLDALIEHMKDSGGGETLSTLSNGTVIRLALCDFTNAERCLFCGGTGIAGSEQTGDIEL